MEVPSWLESRQRAESSLSWAMLMTAMISERPQSFWKNCVKDSTSSKGVALGQAGAPYFEALCRFYIAHGAIRCSHFLRAGGSDRLFTTSTADCAVLEKIFFVSSINVAPGWNLPSR